MVTSCGSIGLWIWVVAAFFYGPLLWDAVLGVLAKVSFHGISVIQQPVAAPEALTGAGWRG